MWDRKKIKKLGEETFPKNYWLTIAVTLIGILFSGVLTEIPVVEYLKKLTANLGSLHLLTAMKDLLFFLGDVIEFPFEGLFESFRPIVRGEEFLTFTSFFIGVRNALLHLVLPTYLLHLAVEFFLGLPYEVGLNRYYLQKREDGNVKFSTVFYSFKKGYVNILLAQVLREILTFLFKLLFFFPGVRHHYELFCVPFILAENPSLSWRHAHHLSEKMTHGYKWHLFCLEYSFLWWILLDALTFHILSIFYLKPRMSATFAEAYAQIRENALEKGIATKDELPGVAEKESVAV